MLDFFTPKNLRNKDLFLKFLAFGFIATNERAQTNIEWFSQCKLDGQKFLADGEWLSASPQKINIMLSKLLKQIILEKLVELDNENIVTMGLSSGLDSRAIFSLLPKDRIPAYTYTFGHTGILDFDLMKKLRELNNIEINIFDLYQLNWGLEEYQENVLNTQDYPLHPRVMVESQLKKQYPHRSEVHSYDMHLTTAINEKKGASWQQAITLFCQSNNPFKMQEVIGSNQVVVLLPDKPLISDTVLPFNRQLDFSFRQAQRVRPQDSNTTKYALPYEDYRWIGFWLSRPVTDLREQRLWISFIKSLQSNILFDVNNSNAATRQELRKDQIALVYGSHLYSYWYWRYMLQLFRLKKPEPVNPTQHFHIFSTYNSNESFRNMVQEAIKRLRARCIIYPSFIDNVFQQFQAGHSTAAAMLKGLVSVDILLETEILN
jgi:hypothetical protein